MQSSLIEIFRKNAGDTRPLGIKDPTIVPMPDGSYMMYATVYGPGIARDDLIGRFHADHLRGPWRQLEPARVHGVTGSEICAPQVLLREEKGALLWIMYVQTACLKADGFIAVATSRNGIDFHSLPVPAMTKEALSQPGVVGLYDVSVSEIRRDGEDYECMVFSGYRQVGCGDLYMSLRKKKGSENHWSTPHLILKQEDVPFHNHPHSPNFEWGLEGAKIIQLAEDSFLLAGVCFLEKELKLRGTRQRVFFATAKSPSGPFESLSLPFEPAYEPGQGENGHPDVIDLGDRLAVLYQERAGKDQLWHLRYAEILKDQISKPSSSPGAPKPCL